MKESDFRAKLIATFEAARNPYAFIWSHDAHFKAGFPDLYWLVLSDRNSRPHHAELKIWKEKELPQDLTSLCSKIQLHIMERLHRSGAKVYILVLHAPPGGWKRVVMYPFDKRESYMDVPYDTFLMWWGGLSKPPYVCQ